MKGELAYKDIHGRVWRIRRRGISEKWVAETLDVGHTSRWSQAYDDFSMLLASIDREEYQIDRATQPIQSGEARGEITGTGPEVSPETIEEISRYAGEIDWHEFPRSDSGEGSTGREE